MSTDLELHAQRPSGAPAAALDGAPAGAPTPPGDAPAISVVLCTHNRSGYLRGALRSLVEQSVPREQFEVIVVDNDSSDDTPQAAREFAGRLAVRYVQEPELGLCHARNTGWQQARGRIVAYLDDDAVASPAWVRAIADAFAREPDAGIVGGRVLPLWHAPPPPWLSAEIARALTIVDWPDGPKRITDIRHEWLAGTNVAVPRHVLAEIGGFDPRLDRIGDALLSNGDILLQQQIVARGHVAVYDPAMCVHHAVPRSRLTQAWFRRRHYWQGVSDVLMQDIQQAPGAGERLRGGARAAWKLARSPHALRALLLPADDPVSFTSKCWAWIEVGRVAALLRPARR